MLREVTSASNDGACLEHCEAETPEALGAHLDGATPGERTAAIVRSRRLPEPSVMGEAWRSLEPRIQNRIGTAALTHSFYSFVSQRADREVTLAAARRCEAIEALAFREAEDTAKAALPELYGTAEAEPVWALSDAPLVFLAPYADLWVPTKMPPNVRTGAIARSRRIPGLDAIIAAWSRLPAATQDLLGVQAVAFAFYGWLTEDNDQAPADRWLTDRAVGQCVHRQDRALALLGQITERSLPELYGTKKRDPAWANLDADPAALGALWEAALPSPAQSVIALHRACWRSLQASAESLKARGEWEWRSELSWPAEDAEDEAVMDLLMTSCRDRADAEAMASHMTWYLQVRPQHPKRSTMSEADAALIAVRLRDLSMILGRDVAGAAPVAVPGAMAGLIAQHRAAWSAYLAEPDAWETARDRYFELKGAAGEASEAVSRAPCADRAEAAAFVAHVAWYRAELEAAGDSLADGFTTEAQEMQARAGDWTRALATGHRLQG